MKSEIRHCANGKQMLPILAFVSALLLGMGSLFSQTLPTTEPVSIPYSYNFEADSATAWNQAGVIPQGWYAVTTATDSCYEPHVSADFSIDGNSLLLTAGGDTSLYGIDNYIVLPPTQLNLGYLSCKFSVKMEAAIRGQLHLGYMIPSSDTVQFVPFEYLGSSTMAIPYEFSLNSYPTFPADARLAFHWHNADSCAHCTIDNIQFDSVSLRLPPAMTSVNVVSSSSLRVEWQRGWNENSWSVQYGEPDSAFVQVASDATSLLLTDLQPGRIYEVAVRGEWLDGSHSPWSDTLRAMTPCSEMYIPYMEDMESYAGVAYNVVGAEPSCWQVISTALPKNQPHVCNTSVLVPAGTNSLAFVSANKTGYASVNYAVAPWFPSDLNGTKVSFLTKVDQVGPGVLSFGYITNVLDANSFVLLETVACSTTVSAKEFSLAGRNIPQGARLAFRWSCTSSWDFRCGIDNFAVDFLECAPVTNVNVSDVMMTTAHVAWTPGASEEAWQVEYGPAGFNHDETGTTILVNQPQYDFVNLVGGEPIDVYVRSMCDPRNPSAYSDVVTFTPYCSVLGVTDTIHACDSLEWHSKIYRESGQYRDTLFQASEFFCDSIVFLDLTISHSVSQSDTLILCQNELPYTWRDTTFMEDATDNIFTFLRHTESGCDSVVQLTLVVYPSYYQEESEVICSQQLPYTWRDTVFQTESVSGNYEFVRHSQYGCDSIVTLHLTIHKSYRQTEAAVICQTDLPYTWRDTTFQVGTLSGLYTFNRTAQYGCDSIVAFALVVNPAYSEEVSLNVCRAELPVVWRDTAFAANAVSGDYHFNRTSVSGCDSLVTLHLTIGEADDTEETVVICDSELPYVWQDTVFRVGTQSSVFHFNRTSASGCPSIATLNLVVNPSKHLEYSEFVCDNDFPVVLPDTTFATVARSGDYTFHYTTSAGCDSTVVLHLTVHNAVERYETIEICRNELPYRYYDTVFHVGTHTNNYTLYRTTEAGCDSVVFLTLKVYETYGTTLSLVVCENELPVVWRGHVFERGTVSGRYTYAETTTHGCDSIVVLNLVVNPSVRQTESVVICDSELPFTWRDTTFQMGTQNGQFVFERQTSNGCDSIVTLNLVVNPTKAENVALTLCASELEGGYAWRDTVFAANTVSGSFTFNRLTSRGCDSIVTLQLTIHPVYAQQESLVVCEEELPVVWRDTVFRVGSTSGLFTFHRRTVNGCDSTVTLDLTVNSRSTTEKSYQICETEFPYVTEDTTFEVGSRSGLYQLHRQNQNGCDSTINISLTVRPTYQFGLSQIICQDELPYTWRDTTFEVGTQSGVFFFNRTTQYGCDSLVSLALIVRPSYHQDEYLEACANDFPFTWRDITFPYGTQAGTYEFPRQTIFGCDSIVTVHLQIHPIYNQSESIAVCQSDLPYTWRDTTFQTGTLSGAYTFTRFSQYGCDSIVTLYLTVNPTTTTQYSLQLCSGDLPYVWNVEDTTFEAGTESGLYFFHHTNAQGCDSNVVLTLVVNPEYEYTDELTICANELPYYYAPENYTFNSATQSGVVTFNHTTSAGCDSILRLSLTVNPSYNQSVTVRICENDLPFTWRDTIFEVGTQSDNYLFERTTQYGCDSVVTLYLFVNPQPNVSIVGNTEILQGESTTLLAQGATNCHYSWNTGETSVSITVSPDTTTTYEVTVVNNNNGCSNQASIVVVVTDTTDTGSMVANPDLSRYVTVYPNPTAGRVMVNAGGQVISEISIYDLNGRLVRREEVGENRGEMDLSNVVPGTYLLKMALRGGGVATKKLIVK